MKTLPSLTLAAALIAAAVLPAGTAQQQRNSAAFANQAEANQHALEEFKRVDAELTKVFDKALGEQLSPEVRKALIASQQAWSSFREADARYESALGEGGSARSQLVNERMTYLTRIRIYQLQTPFAAGWQEMPCASK